MSACILAAWTSNGTTSTAPCNGTLVPRPIRQGSSPSPVLEVRTHIAIAIWGKTGWWFDVDRVIMRICVLLTFFLGMYSICWEFHDKTGPTAPVGPRELFRFGSCDCCLRDPPKKLGLSVLTTAYLHGYLWISHANQFSLERNWSSFPCLCWSRNDDSKLWCGSCARVPWSWSTLWKSEYFRSNYSNKHRVTPQKRCCSSRGVSGCPLVVFLVIFENQADPVSTVVLFVWVRSLVPLKAFCFGFQAFLFSPWSHLASEEPLPTIGILPQCKSGFPNPFQKKVSKIFLKKGVD